MRAGQPTEHLGIVLSGRVRIEVSDAWGETTILDILGPGSLFAHGYACSMEPLDIDVLADTNASSTPAPSSAAATRTYPRTSCAPWR